MNESNCNPTTTRLSSPNYTMVASGHISNGFFDFQPTPEGRGMFQPQPGSKVSLTSSRHHVQIRRIAHREAQQSLQAVNILEHDAAGTSFTLLNLSPGNGRTARNAGRKSCKGYPEVCEPTVITPQFPLDKLQIPLPSAEFHCLGCGRMPARCSYDGCN